MNKIDLLIAIANCADHVSAQDLMAEHNITIISNERVGSGLSLVKMKSDEYGAFSLHVKDKAMAGVK